MPVTIMLLSLSACAVANLQKQLSEINSRPYIADSIKVPDYIPVDIVPLDKATSLKTAAIKYDSQRREYRKQAQSLNTAMGYQVQATKSMRHALKASEVEGRSVERMLLRTRSELEQEKRTGWWRTLFNRVFEAGLTLALIAGI